MHIQIALGTIRQPIYATRLSCMNVGSCEENSSLNNKNMCQSYVAWLIWHISQLNRKNQALLRKKGLNEKIVNMFVSG